MNAEAYSALVHWIKERYSIKLKREAGQPPPWTQDPILQQYRFCNVHRSDDKVSRWIAVNWRDPNRNDPHVWFAMLVARFINLPETLSTIGYPVPFNARSMRKKLKERKAAGLKIWNPAYMVVGGMNKNGKGEKIDPMIDSVFGPLWAKRGELTWRSGESLQSWYNALRQFNGMGSFMAGQVVADFKFCVTAPDAFTFAVSGPGSRRGMNRLLGRELKAPWKEEEWLNHLCTLNARLEPEISSSGIPKIDFQSLQSCLCELYKFLRVKNGEGHPKSFYVYPDGSTIKTINQPKLL